MNCRNSSVINLPIKLMIINDYIPIHYLNKILTNNLWFDHNLIREQCINNIILVKKPNKLYHINTYFCYNDKNYRMRYYQNDSFIKQSTESSCWKKNNTINISRDYY